MVVNYAAEEEYKLEDKSDSSKTVPTLEITPLKALAGDPWHIKVTGLTPGAPVTLVAEQQDSSGIKWESRAVFQADQSGEVDPAVQAPVSGSYEGVDPAGLFWSLRPAAGGKPAGTFAKSLEPQKITVSVEVAGERMLSREVERLYLLQKGKHIPQLFAGQVDGIAMVGAQHRDDGGVGRSFQPTDKVAFVFPDPAE
ncbi:hypothetical protein PTH_2338 [Pelotomaculum thermopropionicum SI]|uniref:Acyl-CoA thioester hydrolase/bile acid-CoA amino acid N-acetyltransferase domain-containing protein n=1 Tax=Pelotomaculum thermopropionicum (strain DSM 13744 / JCM 10971 / SI) TaxID=370438 RepID=A5CZR3_PELTS|nr:hypothetical protein PTH_2338 [Pelotomaculum thermopropionicum SI]